MKTANIEEKLEDACIKGRVSIPDRPAYSVRMISILLNEQCPTTAPSVRIIQKAIAELKCLGIDLAEYKVGHTPYYPRFSVEMILVQLRFKVKSDD